MIHVCSLSRIHSAAEETGASHLLTLINEGTPVERPSSIDAQNHLFLGMNDITEPLDGMIAPASDHIGELLSFVREWPREAPIIIHCWAGISRSTAAAFITACALNPELNENALAKTIRERSPTAKPNARLVALADDMLSRGGRMVDAIQSIGTGEMSFEGIPFSISLDEQA